MNNETVNAMQEVLDQWDMGWIRAVSPVNIPHVTRCMIRLRDALAMERRVPNPTDGEPQHSKENP